MRSIALINQKGGVGKTTTAVNLGAALSALGKRVLLVDMDPQANMTSWLLGMESEELEASITEMFKGRAGLDDVILHTPADRMDIVPSDIRLSGVERSLAAEVGAETVLKNAIDKAEIAPCLDDASFDLYDYLLIDCPPSMGLLTVNALTAAREIIIPVQAQVLALNGIANLRRVITVIQERLNPKLQVAGVLLTMTRPRTKLSREVEDSARRHFGDLVFRTTIRENVRVAECPSHFLPLLGYAPSSCATLDYNSFAAELLSQEGRSSNRGAADQNPSAPSLQETA